MYALLTTSVVFKPVMVSSKVNPILHKSAALVGACLPYNSGALYSGVPKTVDMYI